MKVCVEGKGAHLCDCLITCVCAASWVFHQSPYLQNESSGKKKINGSVMSKDHNLAFKGDSI